MGIARVNSQNLSFIKTTCCFPFIIFCSGPRISSATNSRVHSAEKSESSADASLEIHSGCKSDIPVQV